MRLNVGVDFGYAALITVCLLIVACVLTVLACYICASQRSRGRVLNLVATNQVMLRNLSRPPWTLTVRMDPELSMHGFSFAAEGVTIIDGNTVERLGVRRPITVGAKWSRGLSRGKHVFEVIWPEVYRGAAASVGVGSVTAPLFIRGKVALVGMTPLSWGFDIAKKQIIHNSSHIGKCPPHDEDPVPEKFFMYVDMDRGELGFGSVAQYWGVMAENINVQVRSVHVMVGMSVSRAKIQVFYRGSANSSAMRHPPPQAPASVASSSIFSSETSFRCSTPESERPREEDRPRPSTYRSVALRRPRQVNHASNAHAQAWARQSANENTSSRQSANENTSSRQSANENTLTRPPSVQLPLSPPPPYSMY